MSSSLHIGLIQTSLHWEDPALNLAHLEQKILACDPKCDLIILPEMFSTGFTMNAEENAELPDGRSTAWLAEMASKVNAVITGSLIIEDGDHYFNRLIWMEPGGQYVHYDKRHLFRMANEDAHFHSGDQLVVTELKGWKIRPLICYDLRFPVWSRNRFRQDNGSGEWEYDLMIFVANWPEVRNSAWQKLLPARAIENLAYVAGVNRVGKDGNEISYSGDSGVYDPKGMALWEAAPHEDTIHMVTLDKKALEEYRKKFPAGLDADDFSLSD